MIVTVLKPIFSDWEYRRYAVLLLFAGMADAVGSPLVPLYIRQELHADLSQVGIITAGSLVGAVAGVPVGRLSDRMRSRTR